MSRLEVWVDKFQALNDQDKKKTLMGLGGGLGFLVILILGLCISSLNSRHKEIQKLERDLKEIDRIGVQYQQVKAEQVAREREIEMNKTALFSVIQNVATRLELEVNDLNERKEPMMNSDMVQVSVVVNLKQLSTDRLSAFLENIENSSDKGLVKVTKLQVKTRFDQPDLLDAQMTISTWKAS